MQVKDANDVVGKWIPPTDYKTDSLFGGGILGGLGIAPYVGDTEGVKSMNQYVKTEFPANDYTTDNSGIFIIAAIALVGLALIKSLFD